MKVKNRKYLRNVLKILKPLTKLPLKELIKIVPLLSDDCIHKVCESCHNLLMNTYSLDKNKLAKVKSILYSSRNSIRQIAKPSTSLLSKRKILSNQTGKGIFTVLASVIIPAIIAAISRK